DTLFVTEKQIVRSGDPLAYIENPAKLEDVLKLKQDLEAWNTEKGDREQEGIQPFSFLPVLSSSLGDLQPAHNSFLKSYEDYTCFLKNDYHNKKIAVIEKQMTTQNKILQKAKKQLSISRKQLESARKVFAADSTLFAKNVIASLEYEASKSVFLQQQQSYENAKINIDNQQVGILQLEQAIFDLQQQRVDQENALKLSLTSSYDQLSAQIKMWEQTYLLTASTGGIVSLTKYWQKNQNIRAGEVLVTIVPAEKTKIIGKIYLPPQGAGKVKVGQE
ncbi:MAG: HlyD family secretion protein, partial [Dysgonamonadaceae bacterium]|nr:HlyD family secretion protein [Dysgonamonadaceae bacterium]